MSSAAKRQRNAQAPSRPTTEQQLPMDDALLSSELLLSAQEATAVGELLRMNFIFNQKVGNPTISNGIQNLVLSVKNCIAELKNAKNHIIELTMNVGKEQGLKDLVQDELTEVKNEVKTIERDVLEKNAQIKEMQRVLTTKDAEIKELKAKLSTKDKEIADVEKTTGSKDSAIAQLQRELKKANQQIEAHQYGLDHKTAEVEQMSKKLKDKEKEFTELKAVCNELSEHVVRFDTVQTNNNELTQNLKSLEEKFKASEQSVAVLKSEMEQIKRGKEELRATINKYFNNDDSLLKV